jgi:tRNA(adenine34) deaminase
MNNDSIYMMLALNEAKKAYKKKEVPVGCVIVRNNIVIAKAHNKKHRSQSALDHAELIAIKKASKHRKTWILDDCDIYITLEPCMMCTGAILQSRMKRIVFAAKEPKFGCCGSAANLASENNFNHRVEVISGVLESESTYLLQTFFQNIRKSKKR